MRREEKEKSGGPRVTNRSLVKVDGGGNGLQGERVETGITNMLVATDVDEGTYLEFLLLLNYTLFSLVGASSAELAGSRMPLGWG